RICCQVSVWFFFFFFQAEDGIRDLTVTGVQTCALPISLARQYTVTGWDPHLFEWGQIPTYDIRHHWVAIVNYSIPWGENLKGVAHGFLAGWSLNANANVQSGLDFSISNSSSQTNVGGSDRPNLVGDPNLPSSQQTIQRWF